MSRAREERKERRMGAYFEALESCDEGRMAGALQEILGDRELTERAEARYLPLIRVLAADETAELADYDQVLGDATLFRDVLDEVCYEEDKKLEFVYLSEERMRTVVDIMGGLVRTHLSAEEYVDEARGAAEISQLADPLFRRIAALKTGMDREVNAYARGWYGRIGIHMMKAVIHGLDMVVFLQSRMKKANASPVLKEFQFFLGAASEEDYIVVEMRNVTDEPLDWTEIFWLMPHTLFIWWPPGQPPVIPPSVLSFDREANLLKEVDFGAPSGRVNHLDIVKGHPLVRIHSEDYRRRMRREPKN